MPGQGGCPLGVPGLGRMQSATAAVLLAPTSGMGESARGIFLDRGGDENREMRGVAVEGGPSIGLIVGKCQALIGIDRKSKSESGLRDPGRAGSDREVLVDRDGDAARRCSVRRDSGRLDSIRRREAKGSSRRSGGPAIGLVRSSALTFTHQVPRFGAAGRAEESVS